jgi:uncharacterized membrane protein
MARWRTLALALASVGGVDGIYLSVDSIDASIPLICPSGGIVNCGTVTSSSYSRFLGVPVAILGTLWFVAMLALVYLDKPSLSLLLLPLWVSGWPSLATLSRPNSSFSTPSVRIARWPTS